MLERLRVFCRSIHKIDSKHLIIFQHKLSAVGLCIILNNIDCKKFDFTLLILPITAPLFTSWIEIKSDLEIQSANKWS